MAEDPPPTTTWGAGDYSLMAERLEPVARELVRKAHVTPDDHVLDLGCGTGTAALHAASRGARVVGVDFEASLLGVAEKRASACSIDATWMLADFASAPLPERTFSVVISAFGVMYAADADQAAAAISRYAMPGARIALAAWTPGSFMPAMGARLAPYLPPPPPGSSPPQRWGDEPVVTELLAQHAITATQADTNALTLHFSDAAAAVDFLIRSAGHVVAERSRLDRAGRWTALSQTLTEFVTATARAAGPGIALDLEYLSLIAQRGR